MGCDAAPAAAFFLVDQTRCAHDQPPCCDAFLLVLSNRKGTLHNFLYPFRLLSNLSTLLQTSISSRTPFRDASSRDSVSGEKKAIILALCPLCLLLFLARVCGGQASLSCTSCMSSGTVLYLMRVKAIANVLKFTTRRPQCQTALRGWLGNPGSQGATEHRAAVLVIFRGIHENIKSRFFARQNV